MPECVPEDVPEDVPMCGCDDEMAPADRAEAPPSAASMIATPANDTAMA